MKYVFFLKKKHYRENLLERRVMKERRRLYLQYETQRTFREILKKLMQRAGERFNGRI